jgi:hypothetical protein
MVKCGVLFEVRTEFLNNIYLLDELRLQRVNYSPRFTLNFEVISHLKILTEKYSAAAQVKI